MGTQSLQVDKDWGRNDRQKRDTIQCDKSIFLFDYFDKRFLTFYEEHKRETFKANKEVPDVPIKLSSFHKNCQPQSPCAEFQYPIMVMSHLFYEDLGNISNFIGHLISQQPGWSSRATGEQERIYHCGFVTQIIRSHS